MTATAKATQVAKNAKIFIVGGDKGYSSIGKYLDEFFTEDFEIVEHHNLCNIMLFTGGEDVDPFLYNKPAHKLTHSNIKRDRYEAVFFHFANIWEIPMIGICRGAQFLTVMNGGTLVQHVENHGKNHNIIFEDGTILPATSTHHQMMNPWLSINQENPLKEDEDFILKAFAAQRLETKYELSDNLRVGKVAIPYEPEIVYYPKTKSLAIQPHIERQTAEPDMIDAITDVLESTIYSPD